MEIHHIHPKEKGGEDTFENAIPLCFDCHCDAGHYNPKHPKGLKFSPEELRKHKTRWFQKVQDNNIQPPKVELVKLSFQDSDFDGVFKPVFVKEVTIYNDRNLHKRTYELLGKDPMEFLIDFKKKNDPFSPYSIQFLNKIETYDDYIDFLNEDKIELDDIEKNKDCQPIVHSAPGLINFSSRTEINLSNCVLSLKLSNIGDEVLEDYKVYLTFINASSIDSVNKKRTFYDLHEYSYNVLFDRDGKGEFEPNSNVLVQKDSVLIDDICFRVKPDTKEVIIDWQFLARGYSTNGSIKLKIESVIEDVEKNKFVEKPEEMDEKIRFLPKLDFN
ncbi:HNH endonuclease [Kriegella aquimaris]|uniref:HNH endonuclease n=2 Tax=Kriegella aquimaris TaxID=192904 RepID=A0A1G9NQV2_9FLAO|nr:HNH endonuclease [Kriegella aquimaris]